MSASWNSCGLKNYDYEDSGTGSALFINEWKNPLQQMILCLFGHSLIQQIFIENLQC